MVLPLRSIYVRFGNRSETNRGHVPGAFGGCFWLASKDTETYGFPQGHSNVQSCSSWVLKDSCSSAAGNWNPCSSTQRPTFLWSRGIWRNRYRGFLILDCNYSSLLLNSPVLMPPPFPLILQLPDGGRGQLLHGQVSYLFYPRSLSERLSLLYIPSTFAIIF